MITFKQKGDFKNTERFLKASLNPKTRSILEKYGQQGVDALAAATPRETGLTASSWTYEVGGYTRKFWICWSNNNIHNGTVVAIILQYGHATPRGGYVEGTDYINPVMKPIFDKIADEVWKEVTSR